AAPDVGLGLVVRHDQLDWPTVDAAGLVDAIDRHLHADQRGLAAGGASTGKRLLGTDLVGLGLAEGGLPRRRHQHGRAERAGRGPRVGRPGAPGAGGAVSDHPAARDLAAVPELLTPILRFRLVSHCVFLPGRLLWRSKRHYNSQCPGARRTAPAIMLPSVKRLS